MPRPRRKFQRPPGERRLRKLFVLAVEGSVTEPQYFSIFNHQHSVLQVKCLRSSQHSSPKHVLKRMKAYLQEEELEKSDEAWLVVDRDRWRDEHLEQLRAWAEKRDNYGFALSDPKFEYWLLLHFEDGAGIVSSNCGDRLKRHLPDYAKSIDPRKFTPDMINSAIRRARQRTAPPCTTVYKLVENILKG